MHNSGYNFFLSKIFCFTLPKIFVTESYCSCENFSFQEDSRDEKEGMIIFRRETLASQSRKSSWASRQYFRKTAVSEIFMYNRGYHVFLSKIFCLTVPKQFVGIPSRFQKISDIEMFMHDRGVTTFCRKFVVSQCRKKLWASVQCFWKFGISKNFLHNRGYRVSLSKFFCLTVPDKFVVIPSMFQKVWGNRIILCIIEGMTYFRKNFPVSHCRNFSWASLQCFRKFGVIEITYAY